MTVAEWIHQGGQSSAAIGQPRIARRVEENFVLGHYGAEQKHHIFDAKLVEQKTYAGPRYGDGW